MPEVCKAKVFTSPHSTTALSTRRFEIQVQYCLYDIGQEHWACLMGGRGGCDITCVECWGSVAWEMFIYKVRCLVNDVTKMLWKWELHTKQVQWLQRWWYFGLLRCVVSQVVTNVPPYARHQTTSRNTQKNISRQLHRRDDLKLRITRRYNDYRNIAQ
jgi:hypothetical protein